MTDLIQEADPVADRLYTIIGDDTPRIDLDAFTTEAMLEDQMRPAKPPRVPARFYDPEWKPKAKGAKLNKDSEEHRLAAEAAVRGLPPVSDLTWLEVQLFDNGPSAGRHAHTQYVLKFAGTAASAGALMTTNKRSVATTRYCSLSTEKQFLRNLRRKADRHALSPEEWALVAEMQDAAATARADRPDLPAPMLGHLSCKLHGEGTVRSAGQFALLFWADGPVGEGIRPGVALYQYFRWMDGRQDCAVILLGNPPMVNPGRKATACRWYGRRSSPEFDRLLAAGAGKSHLAHAAIPSPAEEVPS